MLQPACGGCENKLQVNISRRIVYCIMPLFISSVLQLQSAAVFGQQDHTE
jgi:hypothetical protein